MSIKNETVSPEIGGIQLGNNHSLVLLVLCYQTQIICWARLKAIRIHHETWGESSREINSLFWWMSINLIWGILKFVLKWAWPSKIVVQNLSIFRIVASWWKLRKGHSILLSLELHNKTWQEHISILSCCVLLSKPMIFLLSSRAMDKLWLMEIQQTGKRHYSVLPHSAFYIVPIQGEKGLNRSIKNVHLPMMT